MSRNSAAVDSSSPGLMLLPLRVLDEPRPQAGF